MSELMVSRCRRCGHISWPARLLCPACGDPAAQDVASGEGVVREWTRTQTPDGDPIVLGTVELDLGPWVVAQIDDAQMGDRVTLQILDSGAIKAV